MWCDDLPPNKSWATLWSGYTICGRCAAIRRIEGACPVCGDVLFLDDSKEMAVRLENGREIRVPKFIVSGAEGRYEDWIYLRMLEREWKRPLLESDREIAGENNPSPKAAIVLIFWSYFETRIERLLRAGMRDVPERLAESTLDRYSFIGARLNKLYQIIFDTSYFSDLESLGYGSIRILLEQVQQRRNSFAHGEPRAIDDALVASVIESLKIEHEAWIAVFNKRVAKGGGT